jgi:outer membrane protein
MRKVISINTLFLSLAVIILPGVANATSLLEIYQQALQSDPRIHEAEARRLASLEAKPQARGVLLPQIAFDGDWTRNNVDGSSTDALGGIVGNPFAFDTETEQTQWQFSLRQTLFRWDQIVGLRRADKTVAKAEADREAAQQDLIVRVTQTYFNILAAEDQLTAIHANRTAIARQLEQAKQRFDVGLIAITDVQESQAAHDSAVADEIGAKRRLATAREFMREITGEYVSTLSAPSDDLPLNSPDPAGAERWIDLALSQNLALVSSRIDEQLARDEISFRRNGHYPTIDLVASTGKFTGEQTTISSVVPGQQTAENERDTDSIGIQFSIPLFAGGATNSRVREAVYLHRASRENLQRVSRETERQTRDSYLGVLAEISRVRALDKAVESNETALEATQAGFDVGTRTIVDVLNAQFLLYQSITRYYQSRYDYVLNAMRLRQAAGSLQVQDLESLDRFLVERKTPEELFADEAREAASE